MNAKYRTKAQRMNEIVILATGFGEFAFSRIFDFWGISTCISGTFRHLGNFNLNFAALFCRGGAEEKSAGKCKFTESCSEYHLFIHSLCFRCRFVRFVKRGMSQKIFI